MGATYLESTYQDNNTLSAALFIRNVVPLWFFIRPQESLKSLFRQCPFAELLSHQSDCQQLQCSILVLLRFGWDALSIRCFIHVLERDSGEELVLYSCAICDCLLIDSMRIKEVAKDFEMSSFSWLFRRHRRSLL